MGVHERRIVRAARRKLLLVTFATVVTIGLLAGACAGGDVSERATADDATSDTIGVEGPPVDGGTLQIGVYSETEGWNPHDNKWPHVASLVGSSVLEPLVTTDGEFSPVPWLATAWTPNAAFDSYTIALRTGVTFQNGEPFDATAVKLNLDDVSTAPLSSVANKGLIREVIVVDEQTVRVDLNQPWAAFPTSFLAGQPAFMMAPAMLASANRGSDHPIGTGPFTFSSWTPGETFTVTKNPTYWQDGLPHLDGIEFRVLPDGTATSTALSVGDIDLAYAGTISAIEGIPDGFTVLKDWGSSPGMAMTNTLAEVDGAPNPMANRHARLALAYATDRRALADSAGDGVQSPTSPFPPSSKWGLPEDQNGYVAFDVDAAKAEVAAYQAETGRPLAITFSIPSGVDAAKVAQLLQSQWKEAGIETTIDAAEATTFITNVATGKYQLALFGMYCSPDPDQNLYFWSAANAQGPGTISINFTQLTNPTMEAALETGRRSDDFAVRKAAYDEVVRQINAEAVNIWTVTAPFSIAASPAVHGLATPAAVPFGNFQPKPWLGELWLDPAT